MNRLHNLYELIQHETPGGPGGGGTQTPPPPAPGVPAPASPPTPAAPGTAAAPPAGAPADWQSILAARDQQQAHTNAELDKVRKEAAGYRTGNKGALAEFARSLAKVTGVEIPSDAAPDVNTQIAALTKRDAEREEKLRNLQIDNELKDSLQKHGANPKIARALLLAENGLADLDPAAEDFASTLDARVKKLVTDNPEAKVVPTATKPPIPMRSSAPMKPPSNENPQLSREEIAGMKAEEVTAALKKGQLDEMLGRRPK